MNVKKLIGGLVLPVFCLLFGWGIYALGSLADDGKVTCGSREMTVSDTCDHVTNGDTTSYSYEKERDMQHNSSHLVQLGGEIVMGLSALSILWVVATSFRKERTTA